jgi:hypothetical protein
MDSLLNASSTNMHNCGTHLVIFNYETMGQGENNLCALRIDNLLKTSGEFTPGKFGEWRFDKRSYSGRPIPRNLGAPPEKMDNDLVRMLINSFNEATEAIPCWDKYAETG